MFEVDTGRVKRLLPSGLLILLGLVVVVPAGLLVSQYPIVALVFAAGVIVSVVLVQRHVRDRTLAARFRWIPFAWVALFLLVDLRPEAADPLAVAAGDALGPRHILQVCVYAAVGALTVRSRAWILSEHPAPVRKGLLLGWPVFATASTLWSLMPVYTSVRALQLLVLALLALLMVRIWATERELGEEVWTASLKMFVQAVTVMTLLGFAFGFLSEDRFTWPGMHPVSASTYLGCAFLILLSGGRRFAPSPRWMYWPRLSLFAVAIYFSHTRHIVLAAAVAVLVALWLRGRTRPLARYLGLTYYLLGSLLVAGLLGSQLLVYLYRGQGFDTVMSLNGRIPLWQFAVSLLDSAREWLFGYGYATARTLLLPEVPWAGTAHNVWMELLLGIGLVGVFLAAADVLHLGAQLASPRFVGLPNEVAATLLAFLLVISPVSEVWALPGIGFGVLALVHVPALSQRSALLARGREPSRVRSLVKG